MSDAIETFEHNGYTIEIVPDTSPENPRTWDNLGTMVCAHRRYTLGDIQANDTVTLKESLPGGKTREETYNAESWGDVKQAILRFCGGDAIILPLFGYDHGALCVSTRVEQSWFHYSWDGGQLGYIFISGEKVRAEYGWKRITKARREQIEGYLRSEVETYNRYLNGDVYGYVISMEDDDGDMEEVESCWGYYGVEDAIAAAKENCPDAVEPCGENI